MEFLSKTETGFLMHPSCVPIPHSKEILTTPAPKSCLKIGFSCTCDDEEESLLLAPLCCDLLQTVHCTFWPVFSAHIVQTVATIDGDILSRSLQLIRPAHGFITQVQMPEISLGAEPSYKAFSLTCPLANLWFHQIWTVQVCWFLHISFLGFCRWRGWSAVDGR